MAPLVIIRRGAKTVEYRDRRVQCLREDNITDMKTPIASFDMDERDDSDQHDSTDEEAQDDDQTTTAAISADHDQDDARSDASSSISRFYGLHEELRATSSMRVFCCADCGNVVADRDDIIAKSFYGRTGKAFLMNKMFNVHSGVPRNRYLMTGLHTICDVICNACESVLGWKYIKAMEPSQKYKEGRFIMEKAVVQDDTEEKSWKRC